MMGLNRIWEDLWQRGRLTLDSPPTPGHLLLYCLIPWVTHKAGVVLHIQGEAIEKDSTVHAVVTQGGVMV